MQTFLITIYIIGGFFTWAMVNIYTNIDKKITIIVFLLHVVASISLIKLGDENIYMIINLIINKLTK